MALTRAMQTTLSAYKDTDDGTRYLQRLPGAGDLERLGLLRWCGTQYGTQFYCITPAGRAALAEHREPTK